MPDEAGARALLGLADALARAVDGLAAVSGRLERAAAALEEASKAAESLARLGGLLGAGVLPDPGYAPPPSPPQPIGPGPVVAYGGPGWGTTKWDPAALPEDVVRYGR